MGRKKNSTHSKIKVKLQVGKEHSKRAKGHPRIIVEEEGDLRFGFGVSHSPQGREPLRKNPDPQDARDAYINDEIEVAHKSNITMTNWTLHPEDEKSIKEKYPVLKEAQQESIKKKKERAQRERKRKKRK